MARLKKAKVIRRITRYVQLPSVPVKTVKDGIKIVFSTGTKTSTKYASTDIIKNKTEYELPKGLKRKIINIKLANYKNNDKNTNI